MLILHVSDIHCNELNLRRLFSLISPGEYDVVAVTGDLECNSAIMDVLLKSPKRVFFVPGNMDDVGIVKMAEEAGINIDARIIEYSGYYFAGIGGLSTMSSLESLRKKIGEKAVNPSKTIVLAHHPPRASKVDVVAAGFNAGLKELRTFIEEYQPMMYLHGHIHESPTYEKIGRTLVVNAGPLSKGHYAIIDTDSLEVIHRTI